MFTTNPTTDTERVLGQITRGEIDASADAARRIAARHQAAYGDIIWGAAYAESLRLAPAPDPGASDAELGDLIVALGLVEPAARLDGAA